MGYIALGVGSAFALALLGRFTFQLDFLWPRASQAEDSKAEELKGRSAKNPSRGARSVVVLVAAAAAVGSGVGIETFRQNWKANDQHRNEGMCQARCPFLLSSRESCLLSLPLLQIIHAPPSLWWHCWFLAFLPPSTSLCLPLTHFPSLASLFGVRSVPRGWAPPESLAARQRRPQLQPRALRTPLRGPTVNLLLSEQAITALDLFPSFHPSSLARTTHEDAETNTRIFRGEEIGF